LFFLSRQHHHHLKPKNSKERRKERRRTKRKLQNKNNPPTTTSTDNKQLDYHSSDNDINSSTDDCCGQNGFVRTERDHSSAWQQAQADGTLWGGRGKGGREVKYYGDNYTNSHLPGVNLQFRGRVLLEDSIMTIDKGHRYGLLGRNGVGKSTLFWALADH
jgi:ABC-type multidrug transport system fused ATPase/permease subunit